MHWYDDVHKVAEFAEILNDAGEFDNIQDVVDYFNKPRRWNGEHAAWLELDSPEEEDDNWSEFTDFLEAR
jgi:hypothetical protein